MSQFEVGCNSQTTASVIKHMDIVLAPSILWSVSLGRLRPSRSRWVTGADDLSGTKLEKDRVRVKNRWLPIYADEIRQKSSRLLYNGWLMGDPIGSKR